jgi:hypothetical protein
VQAASTTVIYANVKGKGRVSQASIFGGLYSASIANGPDQMTATLTFKNLPSFTQQSVPTSKALEIDLQLDASSEAVSLPIGCGIASNLVKGRQGGD